MRTDGPTPRPTTARLLAHNLRGRDALRTRLAGQYYDKYTASPAGSALTDALTVLEGQAERNDPEPVALRVAPAGERTVVLDLGGVDGRCVLVGPAGWQMLDRVSGAVPAVGPDGATARASRGGDLDPLATLLNVDEAGFRLVVAWLVAALFPEIPHPILALVGEQGTAKSTAARLVVSLVDPSPAPLRTPPREMRSWAAAASASWVVALDNVSTIPDWFSDTLCKAVTGDGIVERALHTDDDINVLTFRRCVALTSIDAGRLAGDLAERLLTVELARIPPSSRRPDADIAAAYESAKPAILGALLDVTVRVLAELPNVRLDELPRMADFARILGALDRALRLGQPRRLPDGRCAGDAGRPRVGPGCRGDRVARRPGRRVEGHGGRAARSDHARASAPGLATDPARDGRRPQAPGSGAAGERDQRRAPHARPEPDDHPPGRGPGGLEDA